MDKNNELLITRIFDAPVEKVWKAWSDSEMFKKWWGPKDFSAPFSKIDFRVGGKYLHAMKGPAGTEFDKEFWSTGTYKEIIEMEKIVATDSFADEKGKTVSPAHYGMKGMPMEMEVTVTFEGQDGKTKMTLIHSGTKDMSDTDRKNMWDGWSQSFDKLAKAVEQ